MDLLRSSFPRGERAGPLPALTGLAGQNQGWKDHAGHGESSVLLLPAEVSNQQVSRGCTTVKDSTLL